MKIVGEVIEHLMGDSYHSVYNPTGSRKISNPFILGELAAKKATTKSIMLFTISKFLC